MALIKCPECGKEVSDKAPACIHCGFPFDNITENKPKLYKITLNSCGLNKVDTVRAVAQIMGISIGNAKDIVDSVPKEIISGVTFDDSQTIAYKLSRLGARASIDEDTTSEVENSQAVDKMHEREQIARMSTIPVQNIPKCPTCQSTNIKKVSDLEKVGSVAMFGLLSQKVKKTWHCNNCSYEW